MKKILSLILTVLTLTSPLCKTATAADETAVYNGPYFVEDFSSEEVFSERFSRGNFLLTEELGTLSGDFLCQALQSLYNDSLGVFENSLYTWNTYDVSVSMRVIDDDRVDGNRYITLSYINDNLKHHGAADSRVFYNFTYDIWNEQFLLTKGTPGYAESNEQLMAPVPYDLDTTGDTAYSYGLSVEKDRIRCYIGDALIFDYKDESQMIAHTVNSPFFLWNQGNMLSITRIEVAEHGSLFPANEYVASNGTYIDEDFWHLEEVVNSFIIGQYRVEGDGILLGYPEAKVLQSSFSETDGIFDNDKCTWSTYDVSMRMAVFKDSFTSNNNRYITLSYANDNLVYAGEEDSRSFINFTYDVTGNRFLLTKGKVGYDAGNELLADPVSHIIDAKSGTFYNWGLSVEKDHIRCIFNGRVVFDYKDTSQRISHNVNSPFIFMNQGSKVEIDRIRVLPYGSIYGSELPNLSGNSSRPELDHEQSKIYLKFVSGSSNGIVFDICADDSKGLHMAEGGLDIRYSDNLVLKSCEPLYDGDFTSEGNATANSCRISWNHGISAAETPIVRLTFTLADGADYDGYISLLLNYVDSDPIRSADGLLLTGQVNLYGDYSYKISDKVPAMPEPAPVPGDASGDGKVSLSDVSLILRSLAGWENVTVTDHADVNDDGKVSLMDVSLILQYLADWDVVLK